MLVEATGGPLAMAYGPAEVLVDGQSMLDGTNGGVRQQLPATATRLTLRAANLAKAAEPVAPYDLRRGVAPGAGLTLVTIPGATPPAPAMLQPATPVPPPSPQSQAGVAAKPGPGIDEPTLPPESLPPQVQRAEPAPAPVQRPEPMPAVSPPGVRSGRYAEDEASDAPLFGTQSERVQPAMAPSQPEVPFRSVVLIGSPAPAEIVPLPVADEPKTGQLSRSDLDAGRVEVQGILCSRQHFNNPNSTNCMVCGNSMLHLTHNLVRGPRPTLGFIVFDDGATFGLDRSYVIGREPVPTDRSTAELLVLHDNNETLSRTHAELTLSDWSVQLVDLNSTNGTYIWDATFERWNQLAPGHPVELNSGDTVALGRRTFVFESVSRS
jgi:hypothetical protein